LPKDELIINLTTFQPCWGINHQILKASLCERGSILWDKEIRGSDAIKGCYYNVIRKTDEINQDYEFGKNPLDHGIINNESKLEKENKQLKLKLKELEDKIKE